MHDMNNDIAKVLISEEQLQAKVAELGAQISRDYVGKDLLLVSILKGSVVFMADLMRAITEPCSIDFMVVSSYGGANTTSTGLVKIVKDLDQDLSGKDVLIVEVFWILASRCLTWCHAEIAPPQQRAPVHHPQQAQPPQGGY